MDDDPVRRHQQEARDGGWHEPARVLERADNELTIAAAERQRAGHVEHQDGRGQLHQHLAENELSRGAMDEDDQEHAYDLGRQRLNEGDEGVGPESAPAAQQRYRGKRDGGQRSPNDRVAQGRTEPAEGQRRGPEGSGRVPDHERERGRDDRERNRPPGVATSVVVSIVALNCRWETEDANRRDDLHHGDRCRQHRELASAEQPRRDRDR